MRLAYICSPYRAASETEKERNIQYARELTRLAIDKGFAPITPHLYMTQCLDDDNPVEREQGIKAGLELLKVCDCIIVGTRYGVSSGMRGEIRAAWGKTIWRGVGAAGDLRLRG